MYLTRGAWTYSPTSRGRLIDPSTYRQTYPGPPQSLLQVVHLLYFTPKLVSSVLLSSDEQEPGGKEYIRTY